MCVIVQLTVFREHAWLKKGSGNRCYMVSCVNIVRQRFYMCTPIKSMYVKKNKKKYIVLLNVRIKFEIVRRCKCFFSPAVYLYDPPVYMYGSCTGS